MELYPAVIVHGLDDAVRALASGAPVTLLSAPGAAMYAGCSWWRALVQAAHAAHPLTPCTDILDCADATGHAMAALRIGQSRLVLWPEAPGRHVVVTLAIAAGGFVLDSGARRFVSDAIPIETRNRRITGPCGAQPTKR